MKPSVWVGYVFGRGNAIRELAENRATIWLGIGLVLLTSVARNYDQTFIAEKPFVWLFGSLLFSLVSGTWLYVIVYSEFVRRAAADADGEKTGYWSRWRCFMGLFWMTAPVAWLYALPVERFCDSMTAAKVNLSLLAIVSLWRVLLMARVVQVLTGARYYAVLLWVLFAAAVEILVVVFFGGAFARTILASMGGMRNSPEEALMIGTLSAVFVVALWCTPAFLILALVVGRSQAANDLPASVSSSFSPRWVLLFALIWVGVAVLPQVELSRNVKVERLIAEGKYQAGLDYLSVHQPDDFAPARVLAPNAFERGIFKELPACFGLVQTNTPVWVRAHLMSRLDQMVSHYAQHWFRHKSIAHFPREEQLDYVARGIKAYGPHGAAMLELVNGLMRIPEGNDWLSTNSVFLGGVKKACKEVASGTSGPYDGGARADWITLENKLEGIGVMGGGPTNAVPP